MPKREMLNSAVDIMLNWVVGDVACKQALMSQLTNLNSMGKDVSGGVHQNFHHHGVQSVIIVLNSVTCSFEESVV